MVTETMRVDYCPKQGGPLVFFSLAFGGRIDTERIDRAVISGTM